MPDASMWRTAKPQGLGGATIPVPFIFNSESGEFASDGAGESPFMGEVRDTNADEALRSAIEAAFNRTEGFGRA